MSNSSGTISAESNSSPTPARRFLTPLTSIRFFAAVHIFVFHIREMHGMHVPQLTYPAFDLMPVPLTRIIERGYYSTSLFFLLSGFVLAYLYIGPDKGMTRGKRDFWVARMTRIYPLHLLLLALAAPVAIVASLFASPGEALGGLLSGICNALLIQAWIPPFALSWNFPTWALSTVVFFYLAFPWVVRFVGGLHRWQMALLLGLLPLISLLPTFIFLCLGGMERFPNMSFWNEFVMRTPLFWLPHFMMGVLLSRLFNVHRFSDAWRDATRHRFAWGDVAFAALCVLLVMDQTWTYDGFTYSMPRFVMRHGALAPLYLVMIHDLARNRGVLAFVLDCRPLRVLGDCSFSIFMLQLPALVLMAIASLVGLSRFPTLQLLSAILACVLLSLLSTRFFEKPVAARLRGKWTRRNTASDPTAAIDDAAAASHAAAPAPPPPY